jgi:hypothetical protein
MGLLNLTPDKPFWGFPFPSAALDDFRFVGKNRRQNAPVSPHNLLQADRCQIVGRREGSSQKKQNVNPTKIALFIRFRRLANPILIPQFYVKFIGEALGDR